MAQTITRLDTHQRPSLWQRFTTTVRGVWTYGQSSDKALARSGFWSSTPAVSAGVTVNLESALAVSAFYACAMLLATNIAALPLLLYRRMPKGGKERFDTDDLYWLLKDEPNAEQTSFEFRRDLIFHCLCTGNGYAEIQRNGAGRAVALLPITPDRVTPVRDGSGRLLYRVSQPSGGTVILDASQMFHLRALSWNGSTGLDMTEIGREVLGLAIASDRYAGKFFSNGATVGGILSTNLTEPARKNLSESIQTNHQGVERAHRWLLTPEGTSFTPIGISPKDSQMIESREHTVVEVCRLFGVSPILIGDASRATWSNYSEARQQFFTQTVAPWLTNIEQALTVKLIPPRQRRQQVIEHATEGFLRADVEKRGAWYSQMLNVGVYSINEVRELENKPPIPGGDVHLKPMNMEAIAAPEVEPEQTPVRMAIVGSAHRDLIHEAIGRWLWKLTDRAARQNTPAKLKMWAETELADGVFAADFIEKTRGTIRAWLSTIDRAAEADEIVDRLAKYQIETCLPALLVIAKNYSGDEFADALNRQLALWRNSERLHRVVDHVVQFSVPPPVETPAQLLQAARPMSLQLAKLTHIQRCVENGIVVPKTDLEQKQALAAKWRRDLTDAAIARRTHMRRVASNGEPQ